MSTYFFEFSVLATAHFLALLSPGPDFFLITGNSIRKGFSGAAGLCIGIAAGNGVYIALSLTGFSLIKELPVLFQIIKSCGALYLIYLGVILLRSSKRSICCKDVCGQKVQSKSMFSQIGTGFMSAALNPKNTIFYLSLYMLMVSKSTPLYIQTLYGIWMMFLVLLWDLLIAWAIGSGTVKKTLNSWVHLIERGSGLAMLCIGGGVLIT